MEYLKTRKQFGKVDRLLPAPQAPLRWTLLCAVDSSRSFIYHAITLAGDGPLGRDAEIACRMAKAQATETLLFAGDRAVQFHGGMGFTYECDAQLYIRRAQWSQQQWGDASTTASDLPHAAGPRYWRHCRAAGKCGGPGLKQGM